MDKDIKKEAFEELEKEVKFGFKNAYDIYDCIIDMFYDVEDFDTAWLKTEIETQLVKHKTESENWERPTDFEKLRDAFDQLNKECILSLHKTGYTRQDAEGDCLDVINELKALEINVKGYCYYHTQDLERAIESNRMHIGYDSYNGDDDIANEVAQKIVSVLNDYGFHTKWNGTINSRIEILEINWKKTIDNIDYNYERVFEIMKSNPEYKLNKTKPFWKFW